MNITPQIGMKENLFFLFFFLFCYSRSDITINESVNSRERGSDLGMGLITCNDHKNASDLYNYISLQDSTSIITFLLFLI